MKNESPLTKEEKDQVAAYRQRARHVVSNCRPLNWGVAKDAIRRVYKAAQLEEPQFLLLDSPLGCLIAFHMIQSEVRKEKLKIAKSAPRESEKIPSIVQRTMDCIFSDLIASVENSSTVSGLSHIIDRVIERIREQCEADSPPEDFKSLCITMERERHNILSDPFALEYLKDLIPTMFLGQYDVFSVVKRECLLEFSDRTDDDVNKYLGSWLSNRDFDAWIEETKSCHFWLSLNGAAICSERHTEVYAPSTDCCCCSNEAISVFYPDGWSCREIRDVWTT